MNNKILIVDDEQRNLKILRLRLEDKYVVKEATSGEEALSIVEEFSPALILLDIMMDGMDGYEVVKTLKSNPNLEGVKVILVSGKSLLEEKLKGYSYGADDYITKPFNGEELRAKVSVFIELFNTNDSLKKINASLESEVEKRYGQLIKSEKLAAIGMGAAQIVHSLKNPLAVIKGQIFVARTKELTPFLDERLIKIEKAADKMIEISNTIMNSASVQGKEENQNIDLAELVIEEVNFLKLNPDILDDIEVETYFSENVFSFADKGVLSQVISNIIKNAAESMINSVEKKITIKLVKIGMKCILEFSDTGSGISSEHLELIFKPDFSTKDGKDGSPVGHGLGLPFCKKVVESIGGEFLVESKVGEGTVIKIILNYTEA